MAYDVDDAARERTRLRGELDRLDRLGPWWVWVLLPWPIAAGLTYLIWLIFG
jgi:hypothetical protein